MSEVMNQNVKCVQDYFACNVFNEETMKNRLPKTSIRVCSGLSGSVLLSTPTLLRSSLPQ